MTATDGLLGDLEVILWPLHAGTLAYAGLSVLPPFVSWAVRYADPPALCRELDRYSERLSEIDRLPSMFFHPQSDFENHRLKPGLSSRTAGQRRPAPSTPR